ncbi:hypothetical protein Salat_2272100 [Sesamum alatum]|uniref:Uncharacterized protein n=1 Tax=Sesamum alatum TaxID=300844 RepID=A0AAE2CDY6_9LAMI|nr:hypothetical protein Salat_2272100 [Sesamum alatum]
MGSKRFWLIVSVMFSSLLWLHVQASENYTQDSLNSFLYDYAFKEMPRPLTGRLYKVSAPVNLSGMEVSFIRLRTHSLWRTGANLSSFEIPPRILPWPFTRRVDILYRNLGNWSKYYYNVPNYTFVTPVIGFLAYDSSTTSIRNALVELDTTEDNPIVVRFPNVPREVDNNVGIKCVRFGTNGTLEFSSVIARSSCASRGQGHFSVVVPYQPKTEKKKRVFRWWEVGIPAGVVGLVLLLVLGIVAYKLFKWKSIKEMERQSEKSEGLGTIWVGSSKMPSASGIRTQPVLETSYLP